MGRTPCCEKTGLNKGKWTAEEDEKLITYIRENGDGSWRNLPKNAGLLRCGKSCRLRWMNYLRDGVKRGNFSVEEEETIVKLHKTLGNKWSLIASYLPGRTDNEIKNYWNSHLSRRIYRYRSVGALTEADLIKIKISCTNKKQTAPKNSPAKNANSHDAARKPPTTDVEKHANTGNFDSNCPTCGFDMESNSMANDKDSRQPEPFENKETRGVNTSASLCSSEIFVLPGEVIQGEDFGWWDGVDDDVLMNVEQFLEGGVSDKSEDKEIMIIDEDLKEKGTVTEKEIGEWGLNIENMDLHACFSPTNIPYCNDEELGWDVNGGPDQEFNLWNFGEEGDNMIWW